jgi:alkanesulfonate monooxygenase SsuD/methylene tetrahydromethanopterin reductase-like flavin-dependent oxidoreductase (luciferase family)
MVPSDLLIPAANAAEELGIDGVTMGEHLLSPPPTAWSDYPYQASARGWDASAAWISPWIAFTAMAASTAALRFCSTVTIAPVHETLALAKAVASAEHFAPGRVWLGVGLGWLRDDYEMAGRSFETRGSRLDLMIGHLRALLSDSPICLEDGKHATHRLSGPLPSSPLPILVGGHAPVALRRAGRADGWVGSNVEPEDVARAVAVMEEGSPLVDRVRLRTVLVLLAGDPTVDRLCRAFDGGATDLNLPGRFFLRPDGQGLDLDALAGLVANLKRILGGSDLSAITKR